MSELTDRERILTVIVRGLARSRWCHGTAASGVAGCDDESCGYIHVRDRRPKPGELAMAMSSPISKYTIGWCQSVFEDRATFREIGSNAICNFSDESFRAITGVPPYELLEGAQRDFYQKARMVIDRAASTHLFDRIEFEGPLARVWIRCWFGEMKTPRPKPYPIEIQWDQYPAVAEIQAIFDRAGFGSRAFETDEPQPPQEIAEP